MEYHMEIAAEHIKAATALLDFNQMHIEVYGLPSEAVLEQMRQLAGSGVPVIKKPDAVVDRLPLTAS